MKKKNQKLLLSKETLSTMGMKNIVGGAAASGFLSCNNGGHSKAGDPSCGETCFVKSCGCPSTVNK